MKWPALHKLTPGLPAKIPARKAAAKAKKQNSKKLSLSSRLRRQFVLAAMLSLLILIILLIGSIAAFSYHQLESGASRSLEQLLAQNNPTSRLESGLSEGDSTTLLQPFLGYRLAAQARPGSYLVALTDSNGNLLVVTATDGLSDLSQSDLQTALTQAAQSDTEQGKVASFKFMKTALSATSQGSSGWCIALLDNSQQLLLLRNTVIGAAGIGLICLLLMLVIFSFVSGRVIRPIAESIERQRRFVSDAGHEIRTPLGIILANADALELNAGPSKWLEHIRDQIRRLDSLTGRLLMLARMDESVLPFVTEPLNISDLAAEMAQHFTVSAQNRQVTLTWTIASALQVQGNLEELQQLLSLLLDNAVKYCRPGGTIDLQLQPAGRKVLLSLQNDVVKLPSASPAQLFERFYRADAARTQKSGGFGIGLSAARGIVSRHKGKIEADYPDQTQVRFRIWLPRL
ncbi:MAG: HAMP domain-containing sensor histidine kinase [Oscillospiraceae bacterium]|nr:HAMP domain-containing sensor histidine kinase [Oscillospiraceae bacterium]MDD4367855.1 HAMP domain-containing sensor histidine kinase [Oscillospiraceae bacterium]